MTLLASGWRGAAARERVDGLDVHRVGGRYTFNLVAPRYYRRNLRRAGFDLVIEDLNKVPLFTPYWSRSPLVLLVHHLFGRAAFEEASFPVALATWLLERPLARVYGDVPIEAVSQSTADDLVRRGFSSDHIEVIPNGVDLEFYRPSEVEPRFAGPTLLYLGRLKRYKRIDLVVRALALLRQRGSAARLLIAGKGNHEPALRRLVSELRLEDRVTLLGYVAPEEKLRLFRKAWVHVLTSPKEGWGIANMEAAACGTPTVASDSPGLRDSVVDGVTGYTVPHGNVAALADRLEHILAHPALRERLGRQAREFAEQFSWDRAAKRTEDHLELVLQGRAESTTNGTVRRRLQPGR